MERISNHFSHAYHWLHVLLRLSLVTRFLAFVTGCTFSRPCKRLSRFSAHVNGSTLARHWPLVKIHFPALTSGYTLSRPCHWLHTFLPPATGPHILSRPCPVTHFPTLIINYRFLTGYMPFCDYRQIHITHMRTWQTREQFTKETLKVATNFWV